MTVSLTDHVYRHRNRFAGVGTLVLAALYGLAAANLSISDVLPKKQPEPIHLTLQDVPPPAPEPEQPPPPPPPKPLPTPPKPVPQPNLPHVAPAPIPSPVVVPPPTPEPPKPVAPVEPPPPPPKPVPAPAPVPTPAPAPRVSNPQAEGAYQSKARSQIDRNKRYPDEAQRLGMSGAVLVRYVIGRDGHLIRAEVEQSSGYPLLDKAALQAVKNTRFDPMPPDAWVQLTEQVFRTRIEFTLD
jgi:protein TonB